MIKEWKPKEKEIESMKVYKIAIHFNWRDSFNLSPNLSHIFIEALNMHECSIIWNDLFPTINLFEQHNSDIPSSFSGDVFEKEEYPDLQSATAFLRNCNWNYKDGWVETPNHKHCPVISIEDFFKDGSYLLIKNMKESEVKC